MNEGYDPDILTNIFEIKILNVLGLHPILNQCSSCGSTEGHLRFLFVKVAFFVIAVFIRIHII